jgi:trehalose synthase
MKIVEPQAQKSSDEYDAYAYLSAGLGMFRAEAERLAPALHGRTIWMVNSTAEGGGVAEILPAQIALLRRVGMDVRWAVLESSQPQFFQFTKRIHNLIHASPEKHPTTADRELYEQVNRREADALAAVVKPDDILVVHDPQPLGLGAFLKEKLGVRTIWRCHIGVDEQTDATRAAWEFLRPWACTYDAVVFTLPEYVPDFLRAKATIIHPSIDPLSHKNRDLSLHALVGIMSDADLVRSQWPLVRPPFEHRARRLQPDGSFVAADQSDDIGLLARPIVTQVSRWDRLKGFLPLLQAFALLKTQNINQPGRSERSQRRLEIVRLVLAGPDPSGVSDDPEAVAVLQEIAAHYRELPEHVQRDVAIITLPMASRQQNALMVNTLQRASDIVVQNSLREGFGLTVAEAMWKRVAILGSCTAAGVRFQVRDQLDGRLVDNPEDANALCAIMTEMLTDEKRLHEQGRNGQQRVHDEFLVFSELQRWLVLLSKPYL